MALGRFDVDDADDAVLDDERNGQLGADAGEALRCRTAYLRTSFTRIGSRFCDSLPGDAFADLHARLFDRFGCVADGEADAQFLRLFVQQQDGENLVIDDATNQFGDPSQ